MTETQPDLVGHDFPVEAVLVGGPHDREWVRVGAGRWDLVMPNKDGDPVLYSRARPLDRYFGTKVLLAQGVNPQVVSVPIVVDAKVMRDALAAPQVMSLSWQRLFAYASRQMDTAPLWPGTCPVTSVTQDAVMLAYRFEVRWLTTEPPKDKP